MCGRYALAGPISPQFAQDLGFDSFTIITPNPFANLPRLNIAPTEWAPILLPQAGALTALNARWSLQPKWASAEASKRFASFNARAETVHEKPAFRDVWRRAQRCLIPMSYWYEWQPLEAPPTATGRRKSKLAKQAYRLMPADPSQMFLAAGIWECTLDADGNRDYSFAMLTSAAIGVMATIHDRQPVVLHAADGARWLHARAEQIGDLLGSREIDLVVQKVG